MRTKNTLYNLLVNIISSVLVPVLGFLKVRLFIDLYGSEINGLQLFFAQIIMYLNIFELSFSLAFRQLLFKPLAEKNYDEIKSIYKGAKKIFNVTGTLLLSCGLIISLILPWISETTFDYGTTILYFLILCLPYGLSYYLMGPNFVIIADQKEYKISIWIQSFVFLRSILMIVAIALKLPVIVVFIIESMQVFLSNYVARKIAVKNYPWLLDLKDVKEDKRFFQNAKYTAVHRLATIANNNTDNIVITAFLNLTSVSIYGAYSYLSEAVIKIINSIVTAPMNSFGNLYSEKNSNAYNIFLEFFNLSNYLASIISICLFVIMNDFVYLWTGKVEYILPIIASVLFAMNMYYLTQRECIITTRDANGLFKESKNNAFLMAAAKIILSILLIQKFGIVGVLVSTTLTYWIIDFLYNPILVYNKVFQRSSLEYYRMILLRAGIAFVTGIIAYQGWQYFYFWTSISLFHFLASCIVLGTTVMILITSIYILAFKPFRSIINRFIRVIFR